MKYFLTRADLPHMIKELFKANAIIKESGIRSQMQGLGCTLKGSMLDLLIVTELDERKGVLVTQNYRPNGTILKRADTTKEKQMAVYDAINKKFEEKKAILIIACAALPYWFDYDYTELGAKAKKYKAPVLISFLFGEYGTTLPYSGLNQNIVHGGVVKALAFK